MRSVKQVSFESEACQQLKRQLRAKSYKNGLNINGVELHLTVRSSEIVERKVEFAARGGGAAVATLEATF